MLGRSLLMVSSLGVASPNYDPDAQDYISRVIAADAAAGNYQGLEVGIQDAYNEFIVGCKADSCFYTFGAACCLMGARTIYGALTPMVGAAPTNYGFTPGDYHRLNGLSNPGGTNYLDSNRANNADPRDSNLNAVYFTQKPILNAVLMGTDIIGGANSITYATSSRITTRSRVTNANTRTATTVSWNSERGLAAVGRYAASAYIAYYAGWLTTYSTASLTPSSDNVLVFRRGGTAYTPHTGGIGFYSIGSYAYPGNLEARLNTLYSAIAASIT